MNEILRMKFGSDLYGTRTPESDTDYKGIYIPTAKEIVLHNYKRTIIRSRSKEACERNTKDDIDIEIFSLDRFLELLTEGQTVALDMLFGCGSNDATIKGQEILNEIWLNRDKLITRNINAFVGYARQQAAKYGIKGSRMDSLKRTKVMLDELFDFYGTQTQVKLGTNQDKINKLVKECSDLVSLEKTALVEIVMLKGPKGLMDAPHLKVNGRSIPYHSTVKYAREIVSKMLDGYGARAQKAHLAGGVDWKALSHAVRVNSEALELLTKGSISFPRLDRELLLKIKLGQMSYEEVATLIEEGLAELTEVHKKSTLRDAPDQEWVDNFINRIYSDVVKCST